MSKQQKPSVNGRPSPNAAPRNRGPILAAVAAAVMLGSAAAVLIAQKSPRVAADVKEGAPPAAIPNPATAQLAKAVVDIPTMPINQAVMVTVELDFGPKVPTIAEGLREVERRYKPDDGIGRTFAVLDAYGEPTPDGKLHMSMHVSSEKPGVAALVFKRTGEILWQSRIVNTNAGAQIFTGKNLLILADNGAGKTFTVDGSAGPASILDANIKEMGIPMRVFWPDGDEREFTFIYSACGCPVKVMVKRVGERTVRTKELPVMFPDDPSAVSVIARLMQWP